MSPKQRYHILSTTRPSDGRREGTGFFIYPYETGTILRYLTFKISAFKEYITTNIKNARNISRIGCSFENTLYLMLIIMHNKLETDSSMHF